MICRRLNLLKVLRTNIEKSKIYKKLVPKLEKSRKWPFVFSKFVVVSLTKSENVKTK